MAIPQFAGTSSNIVTSASASNTCTYPTASKSGDLLLLSIEFTKLTAATFTVATPSGWNLIQSSDQSLAIGRYFLTYWRFRGAETSVTVTANNATSMFSLAQIQAWKGDIDQTTPIDNSASTYSAASGSLTHTVPSVTASQGDFAMAAFYHAEHSTTTTPWTTTWNTNMYEKLDTGASLNSRYHVISNATEYALYGSGATGTRTVNSSISTVQRNYMVDIAIKSAKTGPTNRGTNTVMNGSSASADLVGTYGSGDFFVVATCFRKTSAGAFTVATPAGFTLIGSEDHSASDGSRVDIFYGWRTGGATSVTVSASTATGMLGMLNIISLPNDGLSVDVTDPIGPVAINYSATASATSTIPSSTTAVPMTMCHLVEFDWDSAALFGYAHLWPPPIFPVAVYNAETNVPWNSTRTFSQSSAIDYCETVGSTGTTVVTDATTATPPVSNGRTFAPYYGIRVCIQPPHIQTKTDGDTGSGSDTAALAAQAPATDTGAGVDLAGTVTVSGAVDVAAGADTAKVIIQVTGDTGSGTDTSGLVAQTPASDVAAGADTASIAVAVSGADVFAGADAATVKIAATTDSGAGVDNAVALIGTDTGTGVDTATQRVYDADTGTGTDTAFVSQAVIQNDSVVGSDSAAVVVVTGDTGAGVEFAVPFGTDTGVGTDTATVKISGDETGTGTEFAASTNAAQSSDTGAGTDTATVIVKATGETGTGTEFAVPFGTDTGVGTEAATVKITGAETGVGVDNGGSTNLATVGDTGSSADNAITAPQVTTETGAGVDVATLSAKANGADTAASSEGATVLIQSASDSGAGVDISKIVLGVGDVGTDTENANIAVFVFGFDSGAGVDTSGIGIGSGDTGSALLETATKAVNGFLDAPRVTLVLPETRTATILYESRGIAVEAETRLVVIGFETLRTITIDAENRNVVIPKES